MAKIMVLYFIRFCVNGPNEIGRNAGGVRDSGSIYTVTGSKAVANCNEAKRQFYDALDDVFTDEFVKIKVKDLLKNNHEYV